MAPQIGVTFNVALGPLADLGLTLAIQSQAESDNGEATVEEHAHLPWGAAPGPSPRGFGVTCRPHAATMAAARLNEAKANLSRIRLLSFHCH